MADDIRKALGRLVEPVVPGPEPYRRLLDRVRRRRQRRMVVAGVAGFAAVAMVVPAVGVTGLPGGSGAASSPPPAVGTYQPASRIDKPMVRKLLDSPTRGNLAGDRALIAEIERGYRSARAGLLVDPSLDEVKVLLAHDAPGARSVVVAFRNDTHALLRQGSGEAGASVPALVRQTGTPEEAQPLEPYVFGARIKGRGGPMYQGNLRYGLAPSGCRAETSDDGRIGLDGTVTRTWTAVADDGFVVEVGPRASRWRFTCAGVVRYQGPAVGGAELVHGIAEAKRLADSPLPDRNGSETTSPIARVAAASLTEAMAANGIAEQPRVTAWTGRLPEWVSGGPEAALVTACSPDGGCAGLLAFSNDRSSGVSGLPAQQEVVGRADLMVVGLPWAGGVVLVVAAESAVRADLLDERGRTIASGSLASGAGAVRVGPAQVSRIRLYDRAGGTLRDEAVRPRVDNFGEPTVWNW